MKTDTSPTEHPHPHPTGFLMEAYFLAITVHKSHLTEQGRKKAGSLGVLAPRSAPGTLLTLQAGGLTLLGDLGQGMCELAFSQNVLLRRQHGWKRILSGGEGGSGENKFVYSLPRNEDY